jgi:hypothetical protein
MAPDLLVTIRSEIQTRLDELRPLLSEYERLRAAADALAAPGALVGPDAPVISDASAVPVPDESASDTLAGAAPGAFASPAPSASLIPPPAPEPAALGEVAPGTRDAVAELAAPGEAAAGAPPDDEDTQTAAGRSGAPAPGDGAATTSSGEDPWERIPNSPWARRHGRGRRGTAAGAIARAASSPAPLDEDIKPKRVDSASVQQAILAALGHGSHTLSELVMVTAMTGTDIRGGLRRLTARRAIAKTKRDGKTAYALSRASAETVA